MIFKTIDGLVIVVNAPYVVELNESEQRAYVYVLDIKYELSLETARAILGFTAPDEARYDPVDESVAVDELVEAAVAAATAE